MRLYIIRHADPDYERGTITEHGHREAKALAKRLARANIDRVYCSPLGRAIHTMEYSARELGLEAVTLDWIQEISEVLVELPSGQQIAVWDVPAEMSFADPIHFDDEGWVDLPHIARTPIKRKLDEIVLHSDELLESLGYRRVGRRYRITRPNRERIALFCHGGFGLTWLSHLLRIPPLAMWSGFWLPPSSVSTVLFEERSPDWAVPRCLGLGDVSHLYEANLPVRPRGLYGDPG